jgi:hypothetical protein
MDAAEMGVVAYQLTRRRYDRQEVRMWKNMTWLAAEWRYWYEWRNLALAARLEGRDELPPKNRPFRYTFRWLGVAVALPVTVVGVLGLLGYAVSTSEQALQIALGMVVILSIIGWVIWIIYSMVTMNENGPSNIVISHWRQKHGTKGS